MGQSQVEARVGVVWVVPEDLPEGFEGIRVPAHGEAAVAIKDAILTTGGGDLIQSLLHFLAGTSSKAATPGPWGKPGHTDGVFFQQLCQLDQRWTVWLSQLR